MKNKTVLIFVFFLLLLSSVTIAVQPVVVVESSPVGTLDVSIAPNFYYKVGESFKISVHVYNSSGFILENDTTSCCIHIFNRTGEIISSKMSNSVTCPDFEYEINSTVLSVGAYSMLIYCNGTEAGFTNSQFYVTTTGEVIDTEANSIAGVWLFISIILLIIGLFWIMFLLGSKHKVMVFFIIPLVFTLGLLAFKVIMGLNANTTFATESLTLFVSFANITRFFVYYFIVFLTYLFFDKLQQHKWKGKLKK
jgi:hypothetical protein